MERRSRYRDDTVVTDTLEMIDSRANRLLYVSLSHVSNRVYVSVLFACHEIVVGFGPVSKSLDRWILLDQRGINSSALEYP